MNDTEISLQALLKIAEEEENALRFPSFSCADALAAGMAALQDANGHPIAVKVTLNGRTVFLHTCDGTTPDNDRWMRMKERVTALYARSSHAMALLAQAQQTNPESAWRLAEQTHSVSGGCVPIRLTSGLMIGMLSVSGYAPEEDHNAAVRALQQIKKQQEINNERK